MAGVWQRLLGLLGVGRSRRDGSARAAARPPKDAAGAAGEPRAAEPLTLLEMLGHEGPLPDRLAEVDRERATALVLRVLDHFQANRPDPSAAPAQALRVMELLRDPEVSTNRLVKAIGNDAAMTAKLLKVANSAWYRRLEPVDSLRGAVTLLGNQAVSEVVIAVSGQSLFDFGSQAVFWRFQKRWDALQHHAIVTSFLSGWLALRRGGRPDHAALAGMLHDIGKALALRALSEIVEEGGGDPGPDDPLLDVVVDEVHGNLGMELCVLWALPDFVTDACSKVHEAGLPADPSLETIHVVRLVSALDALRTSPGTRGAVLAEAEDSARALGLDPRALRELCTELRSTAARVSSMFGIPDPAAPAPE